MTGKLIALGVALLLTLAAPFVLRPDTGIPASDSGINTLTVITPHNESIRHEFGLAFATHMKLTRNLSPISKPNSEMFGNSDSGEFLCPIYHH